MADSIEVYLQRYALRTVSNSQDEILKVFLHKAKFVFGLMLFLQVPTQY
jgi:hypothetical protein